MKLILPVAILLSTVIVSVFQPVTKATSQEVLNPPVTSLCTPGIYLAQAGNCLPLGPSAYLTRMAKLGIIFPLRPMRISRIDPQLSYIPYQYAEMQTGPARVYATIEDASAKSSPVNIIGSGNLKYISYISTTEYHGELYFELRSGGWMSASEGIAQRVSLPSGFPGGLVFSQTPERSFGWVIPIDTSVETKRTAGFENTDYTGHKIPQYQVVTVYAVKQIGEEDWDLIGPDEWVEGRRIGRVIPNPVPPKGVTNGRWIEVNLYEQTLAVYDHNQMVFATLVASGMEPFWTRPGLFQIYKKLESTPMSGAFEADRSDFYYLDDVPYTMYYDDARALHGAYWRHRLGYPQSHGCVNLSIGDAHWLFNWANQGEWVYVWDPSGKTPTDPKAFSGGAP